MTPSSITIDNNHSSREQKVIAGICFILKHFSPQEALFPRTIMAASTPGQITVNSKDEIFARFRAANYKDCRINAFPKYVSYGNINRQPANFIFIDLDLNNFDYDMVRLEKALNKTRKKIAEVFGDQVVPTVLWTGGGYHIYLPLSGNIVLEQYDVFTEFADWWRVHECKDLTSVFMGFAERFLTDNNSDKSHTPTIKSCLLRVPYTINVKYNDEANEITILHSAYKCGDDIFIADPTTAEGVAAVQYILRDFRYYLFNHRIKTKIEEVKRVKKEVATNSSNDKRLKWMETKARRMGMVVNKKVFLQQQQQTRQQQRSGYNPTMTTWVECMLRIGIPDFRKNAVDLILAPYLINTKRLSYNQAAQIIRDWLYNKCKPVSDLEFDAESQIKKALTNMINKPDFRHMSADTLRKRQPDLYRKVVLQ
jgi:hypothetical protein